MPLAKKYKLAAAKHRYHALLYALLLLVISSLFNVFLVSVSDTYLLCSSYFSLKLSIVGRVFYQSTSLFGYLILFDFLALLCVVPYLVCYLLGRKHPTAVAVALGLLTVDTAFVFVDFFLTLGEKSTVFLGDLFIHVLLLAVTAFAVHRGFSYKKTEKRLSAEPDEAEWDHSHPANYDPHGPLSSVTRTLTLVRPKKITGCAIPLAVAVNGHILCLLKNGTTEQIPLTGDKASITVMSEFDPDRERQVSLSLAEGTESPIFDVTLKMAPRHPVINVIPRVD